MKIYLFIPSILSPAGTERAVTNLANNFVKNNIEVVVVSVNTSEGIPYYDLNAELIHLGVSYEGGVMAKAKSLYLLKKKIRTLNIQKSLIIGTNHVLNCLLPFTSLKTNNIIIGCEHLNYFGATSATLKLRKLFYPKLDALVVLTEADKIDYNSHIPKLKNVYVVPNEVSFEVKEYPDYKCKRILTIGRLESQKGYDILLDDLYPLLLKYEDWKLTIVGKGSMLGLLEEKILKYGLNNVEIIEPTFNVLKLYKESSLYIMTSRNEGFPMVLLEAQAVGLPVVAYDCPTGPKEIIIEGITGNVIEFGAAALYRDKLEVMIKDSVKREIMGRNAKKESIRFSSDKTFEKWINVFSKVKSV